MKVLGLFFHLSLLSAAFAQGTRQQQYSSVCPTAKDGQEEQINPGYKVKYTCDHVGSYDPGSKQTSLSLKECAESCQARPGCTGSAWSKQSGTCLLSGSTPGGSRPGAIWMAKVKEEDFFDDEPDCDDQLQQSQEELQQNQQELQKCLQENQSLKSACSEGDAESDKKISGTKCPEEGSTITFKGKQWKANCRHVSLISINENIGEKKCTSIRECLQFCDNTPGCNMATMSRTGGDCRLFKDQAIRGHSNHDAYVLQN